MHNRRAEALRECHGPVTIIYDKRHATYENDVAAFKKIGFEIKRAKRPAQVHRSSAASS